MSRRLWRDGDLSGKNPVPQRHEDAAERRHMRGHGRAAVFSTRGDGAHLFSSQRAISAGPAASDRSRLPAELSRSGVSSD